MATGVGLRQISLSQLNSLTRKPPDWCNNRGAYLVYMLSYIGNFVFSNKGWLPWQRGLVYAKCKWHH